MHLSTAPKQAGSMPASLRGCRLACIGGRRSPAVLTPPSLVCAAVGGGRGCRKLDKGSSNPFVKTIPLQCAGQQHAQCGFLHARKPIQMLIFTTMSQQMSHLHSKPDLETGVRPEFTRDFVYFHFSQAGPRRVGVGWQVCFFTPLHLCSCNVVSSIASQLG